MTEPYRIRSAEVWAQAREDYLGGLSAEAVCSRHDLGLSAFRRRARQYGWRRVDQPDPQPADIDLAIYDDIDLDDQAHLARLRFLQALHRGRSVEAARWRRLWREIVHENAAFDAELFGDQPPAAVAALLAEDKALIAAAEDAELGLRPLPALPAAVARALPQRPPVAAPSEAAPSHARENVHDVHSAFSSAHHDRVRGGALRPARAPLPGAASARSDGAGGTD